MHNETWVRLSGGDALVTSGDRKSKVVPRDRAGNGSGCPMHMLVGALGACIALTLDAVAANKGIDVSNLTVRLGHQADGQDGTRFTVDIDLGPDLTEREQKILYRSARLCDVGKVLKGDVQIDYHLNGTGKTTS